MVEKKVKTLSTESIRLRHARTKYYVVSHYIKFPFDGLNEQVIANAITVFLTASRLRIPN